jgi:hypothetical protein
MPSSTTNNTSSSREHQLRIDFAHYCRAAAAVCIHNANQDLANKIFAQLIKGFISDDQAILEAKQKTFVTKITTMDWRKGGEDNDMELFEWPVWHVCTEKQETMVDRRYAVLDLVTESDKVETEPLEWTKVVKEWLGRAKEALGEMAAGGTRVPEFEALVSSWGVAADEEED